MDEFAQYIDVLIQAPLAVIMMWLIYKTFKMQQENNVLQSKLIEKLIDKIK